MFTIISGKTCEVLFLADFTINSEARGSDRLGGRNHQLTLVAFLSFLAVGRQCGRNHQLTLMALRLFRERDNATSVSWWIIPHSLPGPAKEKKATSVSWWFLPHSLIGQRAVDNERGRRPNYWPLM